MSEEKNSYKSQFYTKGTHDKLAIKQDNIVSPYSGRVLQGPGSIPPHCRHRVPRGAQTLVSSPSWQIPSLSLIVLLKHLATLQTTSLSLS